MASSIVDYLVNEAKVTETVATQMCHKLQEHPDIMGEFEEWINTRNYPDEHDHPINIEGMTAKKLAETTYLEPIGVYNYLIYLREKPEEALRNLRKGLPRK